MLNLDKIPNELTSTPKPGVYVLTVVESKLTVSQQGSIMIQNNYVADDGVTKLNFDNCVIEDANGNPVNIGLVKLKRIIKATGIDKILEKQNIKEIEPKILPPLLKGKKIQAKLDVKKDSKYLELRDINSIQEPETNIEDMFSVTTEDPWSIK